MAFGWPEPVAGGGAPGLKYIARSLKDSGEAPCPNDSGLNLGRPAANPPRREIACATPMGEIPTVMNRDLSPTVHSSLSDPRRPSCANHRCDAPTPSRIEGKVL